LADSVEKGDCCDAEISVIQSVSLAGLKVMMGHRKVEQAAIMKIVGVFAAALV
jgi:hypothetical protein